MHDAAGDRHLFFALIGTDNDIAWAQERHEVMVPGQDVKGPSVIGRRDTVGETVEVCFERCINFDVHFARRNLYLFFYGLRIFWHRLGHNLLDGLQCLFEGEEVARHARVFGHDVHVLCEVGDELLGLCVVGAVGS
jgi:hypothetical protein